MKQNFGSAMTPSDFFAFFSALNAKCYHRLTWYCFVHFLGWESLRAGERIIAVDKAPELPDSIRNLVMHATWWRGGGLVGMMFDVVMQRIRLLPFLDTAQKHGYLEQATNYRDVSIGYYFLLFSVKEIYTIHNYIIHERKLSYMLTYVCIDHAWGAPWVRHLTWTHFKKGSHVDGQTSGKPNKKHVTHQKNGPNGSCLLGVPENLENLWRHTL